MMPSAHVQPVDASFTNGRRVTLALLAAVFAVHFLDRQLLAILIPPIKAELGLSDTALGLLSGFAFTVLFSAVGLVIARLADRAHRARVITWSLVVFSVMTALCGLATSFWQLLLARIGVGAGEGGTNPASHSLIADLYSPRERATAMAAYGVGPNVGIILAFGIGGWVAQSFGWRSAFFVAAAIGLGVAVLARFGLREPRERVPSPASNQVPSPAEVARAIVRSPTLRHVFAAAILATAGAIGVITWLPAFLTRVHRLTLAESGAFLALVIGVLGIAGSLACGRIADRVSGDDPRRAPLAIAVVQALLAVSFLPAFAVASTTGATLLLIVPCALVGGYVGATLSLVQGLVDPRARAFSAALLLLCVNLIGAGLGPLAIGVVSDALAPSSGPDALRYALFIVPVLFAWSAFHYWRASPTLARELRG